MVITIMLNGAEVSETVKNQVNIADAIRTICFSIPCFIKGLTNESVRYHVKCVVSVGLLS